MNKKYKLLNETITFFGRTLYRIEALKDMKWSVTEKLMAQIQEFTFIMFSLRTFRKRIMLSK